MSEPDFVARNPDGSRTFTSVKHPPVREPLYTVGHSIHRQERLIELLKRAGIKVVVDVRSQPFSRRNPHFDRAQLRDALKAAGFRYAFMGDTLGGRPADARMYDSVGHVDYRRVAESGAFRAGLEKLWRSSQKQRVALLCSEEDPRACHRHLLVARALVNQGWPADRMIHIRGNGALIPESELFHQLGLEGSTEWKSPQSVLHKVQPSTSSADFDEPE